MKMDLALNNLQRLICHKTRTTNHLKNLNERVFTVELVLLSFRLLSSYFRERQCSLGREKECWDRCWGGDCDWDCWGGGCRGSCWVLGGDCWDSCCTFLHSLLGNLFSALSLRLLRFNAMSISASCCSLECWLSACFLVLWGTFGLLFLAGVGFGEGGFDGVDLGSGGFAREDSGGGGGGILVKKASPGGQTFELEEEVWWVRCFLPLSLFSASGAWLLSIPPGWRDFPIVCCSLGCLLGCKLRVLLVFWRLSQVLGCLWESRI